MVFSSITFLYYFLPLVLLLYYLFSKQKNIILLLASLFFYFYGEPRYILVLIFSCIFNYYFGKILEKSNHKKILLIINLIINFGILFYFKYFNFFLKNINQLFSTTFSLKSIIMPIGISFFTFQAVSYIIDIYKGQIKSAKNVINFATYLTLFPQLIAGAIVRYQTINEELEHRHIDLEMFSQGIKKFIIGLSKKVLIANVLGEFSNTIRLINQQSILSTWLKAISDTLQLYFDFSGYSDMAIGLGLMLGFHFLENFNYPFIANSITDFWRRWHISLSSWFKDYLYIPLGGSRVGELKRYRNIFIVWLTTGLWHGASWNFIFWGLYFAIILVFEKKFLLKFLTRHKLFSHLYTLLLIIISFIIFNTENLSEIFITLQSMFGLNKLPLANIDIIYYLKNYLIILVIAIIGSGPWLSLTIQKFKKNHFLKKIINIVEPVIYLILLIIVTAFIVDESFNPFLYFRF